jgi:hypothetical protein
MGRFSCTRINRQEAASCTFTNRATSRIALATRSTSLWSSTGRTKTLPLLRILPASYLTLPRSPVTSSKTLVVLRSNVFECWRMPTNTDIRCHGDGGSGANSTLGLWRTWKTWDQNQSTPTRWIWIRYLDSLIRHLRRLMSKHSSKHRRAKSAWCWKSRNVNRKLFSGNSFLSFRNSDCLLWVRRKVKSIWLRQTSRSWKDLHGTKSRSSKNRSKMR